MMETQKRTILLVEDDDDDFFMLEMAIKAIDSGYDILQAYNGWEAIAKLDELAKAEKIPSLIVLDINMPKMDGKHTLIALQGNEQLKGVPIVILTTSSSAVDKMFFKQRRVEMITKPHTYMMYEEVATRLLRYCNS